MVISLEGGRRWLFSASMILLACAYLLLIGREFAASVLAARPDRDSLQRAVRLSPGNADYRHRLGRYFAFVASDPQSAVASLQSAVALNPHQARYWFDLAAARQVAGDPAGQREALEHALEAEPTAPDVAWEAANFFLVAGDTDRALREFRVVIENDSYLPAAALQTCWRVRPDTDALLRDLVPPRPDSLLAFLSLLMSKGETDGTLKVWDRLLQLHQKFDAHYLFDYVRYLILVRRPDAALAAWEQAAGVLDLAAYLPNPDNLVVNGDFSLDVLNGGLDWTYQNQAGVRLLLDPSDFHTGRRSLSITFEGPGISDAGIRQWIPVRPGSPYEFTAYYKSAEFQGAGGPQIVLRDGYTGQILAASGPLNDAGFWKPVHAAFTTTASTNLLLLNIERLPAGSPIRGKLWLDSFELSPQNSNSGDQP
ncbi:MAG: carbohydrate binding domain-containing protein [Terriglobales bacterium]